MDELAKLVLFLILVGFLLFAISFFLRNLFKKNYTPTRTCRKKYAIQYFVLTPIITILITVIYSSLGDVDEKQIASFAQGIWIFCLLWFSQGRLRDMNVSPLWGILTFLPFFNFILLFPKGTDGTNKYGEDPRTQSE